MSEDQTTIADFDPDYVEVIGDSTSKRNRRIRKALKEGYEEEQDEGR